MFVFASVLACYRNVMKQKKVLDITAGEWEQLATSITSTTQKYYQQKIQILRKAGIISDFAAVFSSVAQLQVALLLLLHDVLSSA